MKMLLVDDYRDYSHALADCLQDGNCKVECAHDGLQALARAETFWPDLVVLDIEMPGMDGFETLRAMRERAWSKAATFVAHTSASSVTHEEALNAGFHFLVPKDSFAVLRLSNIVEAVRRIVDGSLHQGVRVSKKRH
jgi:CheY-like chemotaxis protein